MLRIIYIVASAALALLIAWAWSLAPFWTSFGAIIKMPWGIVSLADLYLGFACFSLIIAWTERSKTVAIIWIVALFLLGNVVSAAWLGLRGLIELQKLKNMPGPV